VTKTKINRLVSRTVGINKKLCPFDTLVYEHFLSTDITATYIICYKHSSPSNNTKSQRTVCLTNDATEIQWREAKRDRHTQRN